MLAQFKNHLTAKIYPKSDTQFTDRMAMQDLGGTMHAGLHQVHGNTTVVVRSSVERDIKADGMITDQPGLVLCTRWADCQNFVIYAPSKNVAGVLHAGWKGLIAGAIPSFFKTLEQEWNIQPVDTHVFAGPSICMHCAEFSNPAEELIGIDTTYFKGRCADLQRIADDQFIQCGVPIENIERSPDCTKCNPDRYWTYRGGDAEEVKEGWGNATCAMLRTA